MPVDRFGEWSPWRRGWRTSARAEPTFPVKHVRGAAPTSPPHPRRHPDPRDCGAPDRVAPPTLRTLSGRRSRLPRADTGRPQTDPDCGSCRRADPDPAVAGMLLCQAQGSAAAAQADHAERDSVHRGEPIVDPSTVRVRCSGRRFGGSGASCSSPVCVSRPPDGRKLESRPLPDQQHTPARPTRRRPTRSARDTPRFLLWRAMGLARTSTRHGTRDLA